MFAANKTDLPPESWQIDLEEVKEFTNSKGIINKRHYVFFGFCKNWKWSRTGND